MNPTLPTTGHEYELAVLGSVLRDAEKQERDGVLAVARGMLGVPDFYNVVHRDVFTAMSELQDAGVSADSVAVSAKLVDTEEYETWEANELCKNFLWLVPSPALGAMYCEGMLAAVKRRELTSQLRMAVDIAENRATETSEVLSLMREALAAASVKPKDEWDFGATVDAIIADMDGQDENRRWPSGIAPVDGLTGGLERGRHWVHGAHSRHCKTALGVGVARETLDRGGSVLAVLYEGTKEGYLRRMASQISGIPYADVQTGKAFPEEIGTFAQTLRWMRREYDERLHILINPIKEEIQAAARQRTPWLVSIDTLQKMAHMHSTGKSERHDLRIGSLTAWLAALATDEDCCVWTMSQISRRSLHGMPTTGDLRESGSIEEDADVILLGWWPKLDNPDREDFGFCTHYVIDLAKNRSGGKTDRLVLKIALETQTLTAVDRDERKDFLESLP